ncbi:MAG TPA: TRAP transporter large permease [Candidatus Halomonas stercoripullorum]|uniref:TRAP transporter large permease protein n=1 Tax=Candidatus Halomonas stercoripullorum TaxID=2838617 RepID=A0A9D1WNT9_9GAMM|nr:TRAP transporter large permease [Candidatus Halomonas stercoripullorum]
MVALSLLLCLLALILLNVPIAFSIGITSLGYLLLNDINVALLAQRATQGIYSYPFLALPLFVFAGALMEQGGITRRLMRLANAIIGHVSGGLAGVTVMGSSFFGTLCGSAIGDTAAVGSIMIPAMKAKRYSAGFAAALQGCCGLLASLLPPSLTMVVLGVTGNISIKSLMLAGILPGLLMALALLVTAMLVARRKGYGGSTRATRKELFIALKESILPMMMPVIVLGGIFGGIVTVTEAAVLAVVYVFLLSKFVYKELSFLDLPRVALKTLHVSVPIQLIVAISALFAWIVTTEQISQHFLAMFVVLTEDPMVFLLLISGFLLLAGTFMESNALIIILIPILMPVVLQYGIDPVHFSVVFIVCLCIGAVTPPLGVTLMTAARIAEVNVVHAYRALPPFLLAMGLMLIVILFFPDIVTLLPRTLG